MYFCYTGYEVKMPQSPFDVLIFRAMNKFLHVDSIARLHMHVLLYMCTFVWTVLLQYFHLRQLQWNYIVIIVLYYCVTVQYM